jgi:hypothetical protein
MELIVDLAAGSVGLAEPADMQRFSVRVTGGGPGTGERLGRVLADVAVGRIGGSGDAFIDPGAVRRLAAGAGGSRDAGIGDAATGAAGGAWEQGFSSMCAYAATRGWVDPADGWIQAHVEWPAAGA